MSKWKKHAKRVKNTPTWIVPCGSTKAFYRRHNVHELQIDFVKTIHAKRVRNAYKLEGISAHMLM